MNVLAVDGSDSFDVQFDIVSFEIIGNYLVQGAKAIAVVVLVRFESINVFLFLQFAEQLDEVMRIENFCRNLVDDVSCVVDINV